MKQLKLEHGGNLYEACKKYDLERKELLDFSANINPLGIPEVLKEQIINSLDQLMDYPDPNCCELRENISKYVGVPTFSIIAGNGASEIIFLLFRVLGLKHVTIPAPCFSEYAKAAEYWDAEVDYFEMQEADNFNLDIEELKHYLKPNTQCVFICNPNNPTSCIISKEDLIDLLDFCKKTNRYLIIDEAFIELTLGQQYNSMVTLIKDYSNLFIIRAFTKILAIPGLRLGYGIGEESVIGRMWQQKLTWSVNTFACNVGNSLEYLTEYFEKTRIWLANESEWIYNELCQLGCFKVFKPNTNFVLLKILNNKSKNSCTSMELTAFELIELMAKKGILIRNASNFKYLGDSFVRVAIKDRANNVRLIQAFKAVMGSD